MVTFILLLVFGVVILILSLKIVSHRATIRRLERRLRARQSRRVARGRSTGKAAHE